jgi:ribosomal protein S12 methylthiotransferase accessory factor
MEYPTPFGQWVLRRNSARCRLPGKTVTVRAPERLLQILLDLCDGRRHWNAVAAALAGRWDAPTVDAFLSKLKRDGLIVESREALARWTELSRSPPPPRPVDATPLPSWYQRILPGRGAGADLESTAARALQSLFVARASQHTFGDEPLDGEALLSILWAAHGVASPDAPRHRTISSAGNMHAIRWFVYLLRSVRGPTDLTTTLSAGLHEVRFHAMQGVTLQRLESCGSEPAWNVLADPRILRFATALVLPMCNIGEPATQYGNRAALFSTLETGQAFQNAQLMATAVGAGSCLRGDIVADVIVQQLQPHLGTAGSDRDWFPQPALVLGSLATREQVEQEEGCRHQKPAPLPAVPSGIFGFSVGPGRIAGHASSSTGRAGDPLTALRKAQAEAWEREGWARVGASEEGRIADFHGAVDPRTVVAYEDRQYAIPDFPLAPFSPEQAYLWRPGVYVADGSNAWLPAECIHALPSLPSEYRSRACALSTTSGMAAWTDREGALRQATLELIERHAFAMAWIRRSPPHPLDESSLPRELLRRVGALRESGHRVCVGRLEGWVPVYTVFVQNTAAPFTAITTAASFLPEEGLEQALCEAEGRCVHAAKFPARPARRAQDAAGRDGALAYYQSRRHFRRADFFALHSGPPVSLCAPPPGACRDWTELRGALHGAGLALLAFDATPPGAAIDQGRVPLFVTRAVVPGLLPIWFGYGMQPAGLPVFAQARRGRKASRPDTPFIHPLA